VYQIFASPLSTYGTPVSSRDSDSVTQPMVGPPATTGIGVVRGRSIRTALTTLAERAGVRLLVPGATAGICCGTPWSSKGMAAGYAAMSDRVLPVLQATSRGGTLPIISDASSCTEGFARLVAAAGAEIQILDAAAYVSTALLPRLTVSRKFESLALHPMWSSVRLGLLDVLLTLSNAIADDVVIPDDWQCCGFAGDRGLLRPELTAAATRAEAASVAHREFSACGSVNRTCEIAMSWATGLTYYHLLELVERATR
jgi:D-lactate dehydrogenase